MQILKARRESGRIFGARLFKIGYVTVDATTPKKKVP